MDRYVVIGNPVSHSKSPLIHAQFAEQTGQALEYSTLLAEEGKFARVTQAFFDEGGKGANVTVPFKQEAFALAGHLTPEAATAGAVNTLYLDEKGVLCGHNTDGIGLVTDILANHGGSLGGKKILILGAGGATRGILKPFLRQKPAAIVIANRTVEKAETLAQEFSTEAAAEGEVEIRGCGFADLEGNPCDWIFNATSTSLHGDIPPVPGNSVAEQTWCYDLMYSSDPTPFCRWAQDSGADKVMDGLGMLVEQAAESFLIWRGMRPKTRDVIALLRK